MMFQNLKVDIVYYHTSTDFELEFNLCGCCRMRLLTDKADSQKLFVHCLARAVDRSQVIISIGNLFGDTGLIQMVSQSIGRPLCAADNKEFGIASNSMIQIIGDSIPLVTEEGYFGGCIIKSGPQTIILLSDNKSIRKAIMENLIHPYVEEISAIALQQKSDSAAKSSKAEPAVSTPAVLPPVSPSIESISPSIVSDATKPEDAAWLSDLFDFAMNEPAPVPLDTPPVSEPGVEIDISSQSDKPADAEPKPDKPTPVATGEPVIQKTVTPPERTPPEDTATQKESSAPLLHNQDFGLYIEPGKVKYSKKSYYEDDYSPSRSDLDFYSGLDGVEPEVKKSSLLNIIILVLAIFLLLVLAVVCFCIFYIPAKEGVSAVEYLRDTFGAFL